MPRKNCFLNYGPHALSAKMTRLAINPDWSCNTRDPSNARYLHLILAWLRILLRLILAALWRAIAAIPEIKLAS